MQIAAAELLSYCSCSVLVIKKLGSELMEEFVSVIKYLHHEEGLNILVEPHVHKELVRANAPQACYSKPPLVQYPPPCFNRRKPG